MADDKAGVIAATVVPVSLVAIGAILVGVYYYKRRGELGHSKPEAAQDQIGNQGGTQSGIQNPGFSDPGFPMPTLRESKVIQLVDFQSCYFELKQGMTHFLTMTHTFATMTHYSFKILDINFLMNFSN